MALGFYDEDENPYVDSLRTHHNGHLGGSYEKSFYVRNNNSGYYYTNVRLVPEMLDGGSWGEFSDNGWSVKLAAGERRPTEAEWDVIRSGDQLTLSDIGESGTADTSTYYPVWVRMYCPGGSAAQLREDVRLNLYFYEHVV